MNPNSEKNPVKKVDNNLKVVDESSKKLEENKEKQIAPKKTLTKKAEKIDEGRPNSNPAGVIKFGFSVIFIVFGIFFGWMAVAPLATSIVAIGQVSADLNKKTVQHLEGGIIKEFHVKDGDYVNKGDTLIVLDSTKVTSTLNTLKNQYLEAIATEARFIAQEKRVMNIDFPKEILDRKDEVEIREIIIGQEKILKAKLNSFIEENRVTEEKVIQLKKQISGVKSLKKSNEKRLASLNDDIQEQEALFKEKLVDIQRLRELKRERVRLEGEIESSTSDLERLKSQIDQENAMHRLRMRDFNNETATYMVDMRSKAIDLKSRIEGLNDTLERVNIVSPSSGYVTGLQIHTVGGVISPSRPILDIVPKDSDLFIVARVNTTDIDKLRKSLLADIRFSAFDVQQTHVVEGKVIHISADTFSDEATGMLFYDVKLKLTEKGREQLKENKFFLVPGMPAEVMIKVGDRTALSYLVKPFLDMLSRSFNEE